MDVIVTLPLAAPAEAGLNNTVNDVLCPAFRVRGSVSPLMLNPAPVADAAEIVRLAPPEFVRVSLSDFEVPTWTLPKLRLDGFGVRPPCVTPVPESAIPSGEFEASETMLNVPLAAPEADGVKTTLNETAWFEERVTGRVSPLIEKADPDTLACEMVTGAPPVLVKVSVRLLLVPT